MTKKITAILIAFMAIFVITTATNCEAAMMSANVTQTQKTTQLFGPTSAQESRSDSIQVGNGTLAQFVQGDRVNYNKVGEFNLEDAKFVTIDMLYDSTAKPVAWYSGRTLADGIELLYRYTCMGMHVAVVDPNGIEMLLSAQQALRNELMRSGLNGDLIRLERIPLDEISEQEIAVYGAFLKSEKLWVYRVVMNYEINPMQTNQSIAQAVQTAPQPQVVVKDSPLENVDRVFNILDRLGVNTRIFNRNRNSYDY